MYAVIRAGGKQYRVAPGDVIRIEKAEPPAGESTLNFDVLAVSPGEGRLGPTAGARVLGAVVGQGRGDKIIVFHFKRKKQFKRTIGHRQAFTAVRITEIAFDGQRFTAPEPEKKQPAPKPKPPTAEAAASEARKEAKPAAKKAAPARKAAPKAKKPAPKKKK